MREKIPDDKFLAALTDDWQSAEQLAKRVPCHADTARRKYKDLSLKKHCQHDYSPMTVHMRSCSTYRRNS